MGLTKMTYEIQIKKKEDMTMIKVSNLGYPRLGEGREWKELIESYWDKKISQEELLASAKELRIAFLKKQ